MDFVKDLLTNGIVGTYFPDQIPMQILCYVITALAAYALGSLNWAVIISHVKHHDDIRKYGSGNAGMTNMLRTYGKTDAALTFLGDALKTALAIVIGMLLAGAVHGGNYVGGCFAILGHVFPCYYGFKGGKCVAVTAAMALALDPIVFIIAFAVFALVLAGTKYVSLSSISAALMYPLILNNLMKIRYGHGDLRIVFVLVVCVLIIFLHRENIKRLIDGKENKFSFGKNSGKRNSSEK